MILPENKGWPLKPALTGWPLKPYSHWGTKKRIKCSTSNNTATTTTTVETTETTNATQKLVKNLSGVPLTQVQASLLAHGPGFAVTPRHPPYGDYIVAIEQACCNMEPNNAEELRAEIRGALKHSHPQEQYQ